MAVTFLTNEDKKELEQNINNKADKGIITTENKTFFNPTWENDYAINGSGIKTAKSGALYAEIPVTAGEKYIVQSRPNWNERCVACRDSNGNLIDGYLFPNSSTNVYITETITIPENCTTLAVSSPLGDVYNYPFRMYKIESTQQTINGAISKYDLFDEAKPLFAEIPMYEQVEYTAEKTGYYRNNANGVSNGYFSSNTSYYNGSMSVQEGETYKICANCIAQVALYVLFDENGKWIDRYPCDVSLPVSTPLEIEVTIPNGCVTMCVSGHSTPIVYKKTGIKELIINNPLYQKKLSLNGDSICAHNSENAYSYGYQIAENNRMMINNVAVGGGTIAYGTKDSSGNNRHWICNTLTKMQSDADYILFEGGINDYWNDVPLGTITDTMSAEIDNTTFYGALESICRQALVKWLGKKIGFVITHKIQGTWRTANGNGNTFAEYHQAIIDVCKKYSIPVCDLYETSNFNTELAEYLPYTTDDNGTGTGSGVHPTTEGYKLFYVDKITNFLKSL